MVEKYNYAKKWNTDMALTELGIESADDILINQKGESVKFYIGKLSLELRKEELSNPNIIKGLEAMDITFFKNKNGIYFFKFRGKTIEEAAQ